MNQIKKRLDLFLVDQGIVDTMEKAQGHILSGNVLVNDEKIDKCGCLVSPEAKIRLISQPLAYVSRGAEKLRGAHQAFQFEIANRVALDVGISTGGFTDYLLQNQAQFVFGVDVGYGQVAMKLQQDPRVAILERTNARFLTKDSLAKATSPSPNFFYFADKINLVVMDASFISITKIMPALSWVLPETDFILLVKPQFEAEKGVVPKGGIIIEPKIHAEILLQVKNTLQNHGFKVIKQCESPIKGTKGNTEFFFWVKLNKPLSSL